MDARLITIDEIQFGRYLKIMPFEGMQVTLTSGDQAYISRIIRAKHEPDKYLVGILAPGEEFDDEKFFSIIGVR